MTDSEIASKASFEGIRYAQLWEDADVLVGGLATKPGATLVSICSAGDNALAFLTLDPAKVVVVDLSPAQIACLHARVAAYRTLTHAEFLCLMGSRADRDRAALFDRMLHALDGEARAFWQPRRPEVVAHGLGGVGKFERYFRIFRTRLLPLVHSRRTRDDLFARRSPDERRDFVRNRWNNWRWRLLLQLFFSRRTMGALGRDAAFFDHVEGSVAAHVARRVDHAGITLEPADNPYLAWIITGTHGDALPLAWRAEHYDVIRSRLDRLDIRPGSLERFVATGEKAYGVLVDFMAFTAKAKGSPVEFVFPKEGVPAVTEPVAILKTTANAPAAKAFVDFILSDAGQRLAVAQGYVPTKAGIANPDWLPPGTRIDLMPLDIQAILAATDGDKKRFADMFGG